MLSNVTYGYTSASFSGRMPLVELADSIVQTARLTLENAIRLVESNPKWNAKVIYGDTDSLFVMCEGATRPEAFEIGNQIAAAVTAANPSPIKLQFEKLYHPCVLVSKKRYVGWKFESPDQPEGVFDAKGIETVRRDTCPAVAKVMEHAIKILFKDRDLSLAKDYVQEQFRKILSERVSYQDFIFAKEVRLGTYSDKGLQPPAALVATKMMSKDPRAEPRYSERVRYIVVAGQPHSRLADLVMHPTEFLNHKQPLQLNSLYYITKQIIPALSRIFNLVGADVNSWFLEMPKTLRQRIVQPIANHNKSRIDQYYVTQHCIICDTLSNSQLCPSCQENKQQTAFILLNRAKLLEKQFGDLLEVCKRCSRLDSSADANQCQSLDCPVMFSRKHVQQKMKIARQHAENNINDEEW